MRTSRKHLGRRATGLVAAAVLGLASVATASPASASAPSDGDRRAPGDRSLATVLGADGTKFDKNGRDFDIVEAAVLAVIDAKPESPVGLLADGDQRLTAFIPTDGAFRLLAADLTGKTYKGEGRVFAALADAAGIDVIETVLLYHVVAGKTLRSGKVIAAAKAKADLDMASGGTVMVKLNKGKVVLVDADPDARNPRALGRALDINKGNKQIAHGIDRVLRPIDL